MPVNRRKFLQLSFKTVSIISAGSALQTIAAPAFKLPGKEQIRLRFAVASDGHYGQPETDYTATHNEMLAWLHNEQKVRGLDFTVINGDLFHDAVEMLPQVKLHWDKLKMPYHISHGNHDKVSETEWLQTWNRKWHYAFEQKDAAFIVLNTADETGKYICPDLQLAKTLLAQHSSAKHLFVFMHITPLSWIDHAITCPELIDMFSKQQNLKAIFHGHNHDQDDVKEHNGKPYFFDAHIGGSWGTDYRGYRIVEVLNDDSVITYQMNPATNEKVNSNNV